MEEEHQTQNIPSCDHGIGSSCFSSASSSSSPSSVLQVSETEVIVQQEDDQQQANIGVRNSRSLPRRVREVVSNLGGRNQEWEDAWSCSVVLLTFFCFASMAMILGFYGSFNLELGPNSSYLIEATPFFVQYITAEQKDEKAGAMLYGFQKSPSLDLKTTWSQNHSASIVPYLYKEWTYYLNAGSRLEISYNVTYPSYVPVFLVIAEGKESLLKWIVDPSYPNTTLSWNIVYGSGNIGQEIIASDTYYLAVGNLNTDTALVDLNITIHSEQYNISNAYFNCSLSNHQCSFRLHYLFKPNYAVVTSPGLEQVKDDEDWCIEVSFGAQWTTYVCGSCIITAMILALLKVCNLFETNSGYRTTEIGEERESLLSPKDDARSNWGSSYDSLPDDEDDLEENLIEGGKLVSKEGEANGSQSLCVVCFDAPRDCFFLPCGHCATCFTCGLRIEEEVGKCPICRRRMKKVRKIFAA